MVGGPSSSLLLINCYFLCSMSESAGVAWPSEGGKVSTTSFGKAVWLAACSKLESPEARDLEASIKKEKNWRKQYAKHVLQLVNTPPFFPASSLCIPRVQHACNNKGKTASRSPIE